MTEQHSHRFCILPARAVEDRRLTPAAFRVLACLGTYSDKDGWCWPGMGTMAERIGVKRQAVQRQIKALCDLGYIEVQAQTRKDKSHTSNRYRLLFDRALFSAEIAPGLDDGGVQRHVAGGQPLDVAGGATSGCCPQDIEGPSRTPHTYTADFEKVWAALPSRRNHSNPKKPAGQKFDAAVKRGVDPEKIIRGAENYARFVEKEGTDPRFVAQAATWLNQERWEQYQELVADPTPRVAPL